MSERLIKALDEVKHHPEITLGDLVDRLGDESLLIVSLICIIPFMQPIPIPGFSTLLGLVVFLQGLGLILGMEPLLTKKMKGIKLTNHRMEMMHKAAVKFDKFTSLISVYKHPAIRSRGLHIVSGFTIMLAAAFLSLPLPIPFSNFIPAVCIFFICAGLLECDLILIIFGHAIAATIVWMIVASYGIIVESLHTWWWF